MSDSTESAVQITDTKILSNEVYVLKRVEYEAKDLQGNWKSHARECYDRGNGAAVLMYDRKQGTVILVNQFRLPTYLNGNEAGYLIEACAGALDEDSPEACVIREAQEETGIHLTQVEKVAEVFMSPGTVTEILHLFIAEYSADAPRSKGGGIEDEDIEVLEIKFIDALEQMKSGKIRDAKTLILLQHLQLSGLMSLNHWKKPS